MNRSPSHSKVSKLLMASATLVACVCAGSATAQDYPRRPVTLMYPFAAGSTVDSGFRAVAAEVSKTLGQNMVVETRAGATGIVALNALKSAADPHVLSVFNNGTLITTPLINPASSVEQGKDYVPVALVLGTNLIFVANPSLPFRNLRQMIDYAKSNPGKLDAAIIGTGSNSHLSLELLKAAAGINILAVPYKGETQAIPDVITGAVKMGVFSVTVKPFVESGRIQAIATTGAKRWSSFPNTPAVKEAGYDSYDVMGWFAVVAAPNTPPDIVNKLSAAFNAAIQNPQVKKTIEDYGLDVLGGDAAQLSAKIKSELVRWAPIIRTANLKP